jgi:flagellin
LYGIRLDSGSDFNVKKAGGDTLKAATTTGLDNNLGAINVTTRDGAEKAIITADYALKDMDAIRSGIGSTQNQLESTVRNISVTQVNITAAESQIRDVDFAAESATFSKLNILAQSGTYAMSQANAVQKNVMKLLQ